MLRLQFLLLILFGVSASADHHGDGNTRDTPIDLIWVALKPGCMGKA